MLLPPQIFCQMKYRHALALNPYYKDSTGTNGVLPPTGLEYIASALSDHVERVTLIDLRFEKEYATPEALNELISKDVDLLAISINWYSQFNEVCQMVSQLHPGVLTVVGGHTATNEVETIFQRCPNVDIIARSEGEVTVQEIAAGKSLSEIKGISYRVEGKIVHNENRAQNSLNNVKFPDRSLRRYDYQLIQHGIRLTGLSFDTVLTARGCPYSCKFCTISMNPLGQKTQYSERSVESVIEELKQIKAEVVVFCDDNFFTNPKRIEELCDQIIENKIRKRYVVQARIEVAKHESLLAKAEKAGFSIFLMGIESPHDKVLKQFRKGFTQKKIREAFQVLNKYNIFVHGYFIYGNIDESEEEMVYIAQFAKELNLDTISFQKLRIEKYSMLAEIIEKTPGYYYNKVGDAVYSDRYNLDDLRRIRNRIKSEYYNTGKILDVIKKLRLVGIFRPRDVFDVFLKLPFLLYKLLKREVEKKSQRKRLRAA